MSDLCRTFQDIADSVWRDIAAAHKMGLPYTKETITENNLLHLCRRHPDEMRVFAFPKNNTKDSELTEKETGADWEWWFGGESGWLGLRVQAKKIKFPEDSFEELGFRGKKGDQLNNLIEQAEKFELNPVYCLYVSRPEKVSPNYCPQTS